MPRRRGTKIHKPEERITNAQINRLLGPVGASGTLFYTGYYNIHDELEYVSDLKDAKAIDTYNRMRRSDGQVKLALLALQNPIINADWSLHPPGDPAQDDPATPEEEEQTKRLNEWIFGEEFQFTETLRQILGMFWAGFSVFEKLYAVEEDGTMVIKKLAPRLQNTIKEWKVTPDGELEAIRQVIYGAQPLDVWIDGNKVVVFTFQQEGDDFRGISALRTAYKHWFHKDFFYRVDAMRIERWGLGIPKIMEDDTITPAGRKASLIEAVENMRAHEKGYIYVPRGYKVEMMDSGAGKMVDPIPSIQHHDAQILKTIMAQFLELGMTETGARSLGETLKNQYLMSLQHVANYVAEKLNKHVIKPVAQMNYGEDVRPPYLCASGVQAEDMSLIAGAFNQIGNSGLVTKGPKMEGYIRETLGIPNEDEKWLEEQEQMRENAANAFKKAGEKEDPDPDPDAPEDGEAEDASTDDADTPPDEDNEIRAKAKAGTKGAAAPDFVEHGKEAPVSIVQEFWRPLKEGEQYVSLRAIAGRLDDAREEIVRATRDSRDQLVNELMPQIATAYQQVSPAKVKEIDYSDELARKLEGEVQDVLFDVYDFGYQQVENELSRQSKKRVKNAFPQVPEGAETVKKAKELIEAHSFALREISLDKVVDAARASAATSIRTGLFVADEIRRELEQFSENKVRDGAGYTVNDANSMGRQEAIEDNWSDIEYLTYSAILDENTCGPCAAVDQKDEKYFQGDPAIAQYSPPLYNCEGKGRCRCMWIEHLKGEKAPGT